MPMTMVFRNPTILLSLFLASCVNTPEVEFDTDSVFEGLGFWVVSPFRNRPTYSYHWYGAYLQTSTPIDNRVEIDTITISDCEGLEESLARLHGTILETAQIIAGEREPLRAPEIVVDGPIYQLTYFPPMIGGSITLESYESGDVPWIDAGLHVKQLAERCNDS